jgi:hypothetical protein
MVYNNFALILWLIGLICYSYTQISGNQMIERLQHIFASSSHTYGSLTLDFHYNRLGPAALFQVFTIPETYLSK